MQNQNNSHFSFMEKLEDRILFDAVPDGSFIIPSESSQEPQVVQQQAARADQAARIPSELILIDAGVEDGHALLQSILSANPEQSYEVRFIESDQSGIDQVSSILSERRENPFSAIHIISHGEAGRVQLGNTFLDSNTINDQAADIAAWGNSLTLDADLLIYGCDLAGNDDGKSLTARLADLTGADVAASTDLTGNASAGGDWQLEHQVGSIQANSFRVQSWSGTLAVAIDDNSTIQADTTGTANGNVLSNDFHTGGTITEVHAYASEVGNAFQLSYGAITINADGSYSYDVDENHAAVIGLRVGEVLEEIVSYEVTDTSSDTGILVIRIIGVEDELVASDDFDDVTTVTDTTASGNLITDTGVGQDIFDRGLSQLIWENEYGNGAAVNGTSRTIDGIRVDISTSDPDGAGSTSNHTVSYATNGGHSGYLRHNLNGGIDPNSEVTTTFDFDAEVFSLSFILADIDRDQFAPISWQDQFSVVGTNGGAAVSFSSLVAGTVTESPSGTFYGDGSVPPSEAHGNVNIVFDGPVDSVTITYKYGPSLTTAPSGILGAVSDLSWQPPIDVFVAAVDGSAPGVGVPYAGQYGTFLINRDGSYTYTVNDSHPDVIALGSSEVLIDSVQYTLENTIAQTSSAIVHMTIHGINEVPTLDIDDSGSGSGFANTFTEAAGPVTVADTDVIITDIDNPDDRMSSLTITPNSVVDNSSELLIFNGDLGSSISFPMGAATSTQQITLNSVDFNVAYDGTNFVVTNFAGGDMLNTDLQLLIAGITYNNIAPGLTAGDRTFDFVVSDGEANSNVATSRITVNTDPDASQWSLTGATNVDEGGTATYNLALNNPLRAGETALINLQIVDVDTNSSDYVSLTAAINAAIASNPGPGSFAWDGTTLTYTSDGTGVMSPLVINIAATDDSHSEGSEDYTLAISSPASTTGETISASSTQFQVTTTIADTRGVGGSLDGTGRWNLTGPASVDEGAIAQYTVTLSGTYGIGEILSIDLDLNHITTNDNDFDLVNAINVAAAADPTLSFDSSTGTITFTAPSDGASMTPFVINLPITDENTLEGVENFNLSLSNPATTTGAIVSLGTNTSVSTTINDTQGPGGAADGPGTWNISGPSSTDEGSNAQFTISLNGSLGIGETAFVEINLSDLTTINADRADWNAALAAAVAVAPDFSFNSTTGVLTYTAPTDGVSMPNLVVDLAIVNDSLLEGPENFSIILSNAGSSTGANIGIGTSTATTQINDTQGVGGAFDGPGIWNITGPTNVNEGGTAQYTISLSGNFGNGESASVTVNLNDIDTNSSDYGNLLAAITAAASTDPNVSFNSSTNVLTFLSPAEGTSMSDLVFDLPISIDGFTEGNEDYSIDLSTPTSPSGVNVAIGTGTARTTIIDADAPNWSVSGPVNVDEGSTAQYSIGLNGTFGNGVVVSVDLDVNELSTNSGDYADLVTAITNAAAAHPNVSYSVATGTLTFTSPFDGSSMSDLVIDLPINNDSIVEGPESFSWTLSNPNSSGVSVGITTPSVTTTVNDTQGPGGLLDGPAQWNISGPTSGDEGETVQYIISLNGAFGIGENASVTIDLNDQTSSPVDHSNFITAITAAAAGNSDVSFDSSTGILTYTASSDGASMSNLLVSLTLTDDNLIEGPENYSINLASASSTSGANVSISNGSVTTTIRDTQGIGGSDDGPAEWAISGPTSRDEGDTASYTISLSGTFGAGEIISVDLDLSNVTTNSNDYGDFIAAVDAAVATNTNLVFNSTTGTLTFTSPTDGASMVDLAVTLPITNDAFIEGAESFRLGLSNASSSSGANTSIDLANSQVSTAINDTQGSGGVADGPGLWNLSGPLSSDEGSTAQYSISLSGAFGVGETVSVQIDLSDITTNASDYGNIVAAITAAAASHADVSFVSATNTLRFTAPSDGASMTDLLIDLSISNDNLIEGAETFSLGLANALSSTGAPVGINNPSVTTTINDTQGVGGTTDGPGVWSITGTANSDEGSTASYNINLSGRYGVGEVVSVDLSFTDLTTNNSDRSAFETAVTTAVSSHPNISFDSTTGTLTYTSTADGESMPEIVVNLTISDDNLIEGPESFSIELSNANSSTGASASISLTEFQTQTTINDTQGIAGAIDGPGQWSLSGPTDRDEGSVAQYTVSLGGSFGAGESTSVTLALNGNTTNSNDYGNFLTAVNTAVSSNPNLSFNSTTGLLTYTAPTDGAVMSNLVIDLAITNDNLIEGSEDFSINLSDATTTTGANIGIDNSSVTTTINDTQGVGGIADGPGIWAISGPTSQDEGSTGTYTVSLSGNYGIGESVSVDLGLLDTTTNSNDYASFLSAVNAAAAINPNVVFDTLTGTLTFTSPSEGASMSDLSIELAIVDDGLNEGPESFRLRLSNSTSSTDATASISSTQSETVTTINDTQGVGGLADGPALWNISGPATRDEGSTAQYIVSLSGTLGVGETASVLVNTSHISTSPADIASFTAAVSLAASTDPAVSFNSSTGVLTYTAPADGSSMSDITIDLLIENDVIIEGQESFSIGLTGASSSTGANIGINNNTVTTTINDTQGVGGALDGPATWAITGPSTREEGQLASYTVSLSGNLGVGESVSVEIDLVELTSQSNDHDSWVSAINAAVTANPNLSFDSISGTLTFVSPSDGASMSDLVIELGIANDSHIEGSESYSIQLSGATSSTGANIAIQPAATQVTTVISDTQGVGGALDGPGLWNISGPASGDEGETLRFTVSLGGTFGVGETTSVDIELTDVSTKPSDYADIVAAIALAAAANPDVTFSTTTGTLTFTSPSDGSGMADLLIDLVLVNDSNIEGQETFSITLSNVNSATGANVGIDNSNTSTTIEDTQGVGGVADGPGEWSISGPLQQDEGETASYTIDLTGSYGIGEIVNVELGISDVSTNANDYANFLAAVSAAVASDPELSFNSTTGILTFTSSVDGSTMNSLNIQLAIQDDNLVEGPESFVVGLSNATSTTGITPSISSTQSQTTTFISDTQGIGGAAEQASWSIVGNFNVDEGETATYTVSLDQTLQAAEIAQVQLIFSDLGTNSSDYSPFNTAVLNAVSTRSDLSFDNATGILTYTSDGNPMSNLVINLPITDDSFVEGAEQFQIRLANAASSTGSEISIDNSQDSVTTGINDTVGVGGTAEEVVWTIGNDQSVDEGSQASYRLRLTNGILQNGERVSVQIALSDITTNSSDYASFVGAVANAVSGYSGPGTLAFNTGSQTIDFTSDGRAMDDLIINLPLIDDAFAEGPESFRIQILNAASKSGATVSISSTDREASTTIDDRSGVGADQVTWKITGDSTVDEGGIATHTIELNGMLGIGESASINLNLSDTDTDSDDYSNFISAVQSAVSSRSDLSFNPTTQVLTYTGDGTQMNDLAVQISAIDDSLIEGPETFVISLSNPTSTSGAQVNLDSVDRSVTTKINDTVGNGGVFESALWSLTGPPNVNEGSNAEYSLSLSGTLQSGETASVELALSDLTTNSSDYQAFATAIQNAVTAYSGPGSLAYNIGTQTLTFTSDGNPMSDITITLATNNDTLSEGNEQFIVQISNPSSTTGSETFIGTDSSVSTTIIDDDVSQWSISGPTQGDEGGSVQYSISLSGSFGTGEQASVEIDLSDLTTSTSDHSDLAAAISAATASRPDLTFNSSTGVLTFTSPSDGSGMPPLTFALNLNDDSLIEGVENFEIALSNPTTGSGIVVDIDSSANRVETVINDTQGVAGTADGPSLWSITGPLTEDEGGVATFRISLAGQFGAGESVSIDIGILNHETADNDYGDLITQIAVAVASNPNVSFNPLTGTLTYVSPIDGASMSDVAVELPLVDDIFAEGMESFSIQLTNPGTTTGAAVGIGTGLTSTTINDTQGVGGSFDQVGWSLRGSTNVEEGGYATYAISLDGIAQAGETFSVVLAAANLDTTSADYGNITEAIQRAITGRSELSFDSSSGTLSYVADGAPLQDIVFSLQAVSDQVVEPTEHYQVSLSAPTSSTGALSEVVSSHQRVVTSIETRETSGGNTSPIATDDYSQIHVGEAASGNLLSNDGSPDGDILRVVGTPLTGPNHGTVLISPDGTFTYQPNSGFTGIDSFTYTIVDPDGQTDTANVTIRVVEDLNGLGNDGPVAVDDGGIGQKNTPIAGNLLANDSDPNGDAITVNLTPILTPSNGILTINLDGTFTYVPNEDFVGTDSFVYQLCDSNGACENAVVHLTIFDNPPIAASDINNTLSNTPVTGNVLINDQDPNPRDTLTVNPTPVTAPLNGSLVLRSDGTYTYVPDTDFIGTDSFQYEVCDEGGNCQTSQVTIEVRNTNLTGNNAAPIAHDDQVTLFQDGSVTSSLVSNDGDPTGDSINVNTTPVTAPTHGDVVIHADGTFTYTPSSGYLGTDTFVYEICDNNGGCDTAIVTIQVVPDRNGPVNDPPQGGNDSVIGQKNRDATGNLLSNDTDPNNDTLTINTVPTTPPQHGSLTLNSDGTFTYVPDAGFEGNDSFTYEVCDDQGACTEVTAVITIFNEPPVAVNDQFSVIDGSLTEDVSTNDFDPNGDPLSATLIDRPEHGSIVWNTDGTFTYTPGPTYTGEDSFTYVICDDSGACGTATVILSSPFAFDSFTNQATDQSAFAESKSPVENLRRELLLSQQIGSLAPEPILAGYAQPGATLVGRIYDPHGGLVAEVSTTVNRAGNWVMHFFDVDVKTNYIVMIEHVASEAVAIGDHHFRLTPNTYRALQLGANHVERTTIGTILSDSPSNSLEIWHQQNVNPLRLL